MKLLDTVEMMNSEDFKEKFRAEYFQLINRIDDLGAMLIKYRKGTLESEPKCSLKLLDGQFSSMKMYATHLVERAKIEGISLEEIIIDNKAATTPPKTGDVKQS